MAEHQQGTASLTDYLVVLLRWRKVIALNVLAVAVVTAVVSLVIPQWYTSSGSVIPSEQSGLEAGLLSFVQASLPIVDLPGTASPGQVLIAIMESRRVRESVVRRNDLMNVYRTKTIDEAILTLKDRTGIVLDEYGIVRVSVEERDPVRARDVAMTYLSELETYNSEVRSTTGQRVREFLEGRLDEIRERMAEAEQALVSFEREHASVEMTEQARAVIEALAALEAHVTMNEIQLRLLRGYASDDHPEVVRLESELREYRRQLVDLMVGREGDAGGLTPPLSEMPGIGMELAKLMRETEVLNRVYLYLVQEYEAARIQESRDTPTIQTLDAPQVPEIRTRPRRTLMVIVGALIGLVVGILAALALEFLHTTDSGNSARRNVDSIVGMLRSDMARLRGRGGPRDAG